MQRMDKAKGTERKTLLDQLRMRKYAEQEVLRRLDQAENSLLAAFPDARVK